MPLFSLGDYRVSLPQDGDYWIAPTAVLIGRVTLAAEASVWFGAVLRGDTDDLIIGPRTNVQDNAVLHADPGSPLTIGGGCTIGHSVILHGCDIGEKSLIGIGSTILNRSRIGSYCLVGANSFIGEGKSFPDRSLILGAPARVARPLTEAEIAFLSSADDLYVQNWRRFKRELKADPRA